MCWSSRPTYPLAPSAMMLAPASSPSGGKPASPMAKEEEILFLGVVRAVGVFADEIYGRLKVPGFQSPYHLPYDFQHASDVLMLLLQLGRGLHAVSFRVTLACAGAPALQTML